MVDLEKSQKVMEGHGKSWKVMEVRSVTTMVSLEKSQKVMESHGR